MPKPNKCGSLVSGIYAAIIAVAFCLLLAPAAVSGQNNADALHQMSNAFESLVTRISPAVVEVFVSGYGATEADKNNPEAPIGRESSLGSGVIVDPDGYIVTNFHVIKGAQRVSVLVTPPLGDKPQVAAALREKSRTLPAKVIGGSEAADLAVLKIDAAGLPTVPFARYDHLRQGQLVLAFGSPEGLRNSVSMGLVSAVLRQADPESPMVFIQTDAAINPGNSGGPLVDVDGNLVGINSSILTKSGGNEGIGFAIPSGIVRFVYEQIRRYGHVRRGDIGADVQSITPELATALGLSRDTGVIVSDVIAGGPADQAGLKVSDLIETIDGMPVENVPTFIMSIFQRRIGDRVNLGIVRGKQEMPLSIPLVEMAQGPAAIADFADPVNGMLPQLGVIGVDLTPEVKALLPPLRLHSGVVVAATTPDHRAQEIGLQSGDVIHLLNTHPVISVDLLKAALHGLKPGDAAALQIERNGRLFFLTFEAE